MPVRAGGSFAAGRQPCQRAAEVVGTGLGEAQGEALVLHLPEGELRISLSMRERELKGVLGGPRAEPLAFERA